MRDPTDSFAGYRHELSGLADEIAEGVEGLGAAMDDSFHAMEGWLRVVINSPDRSDGVTFAFTQIGNEFLDLLYDCAHGRGRPALKACRSLFELLVTVMDVIVDPAARGRYEDHRWVVFALDAELENLRPVRQKGDKHRRKKALSYVKPHLGRVLNVHGSSFRLSWRAGTLKHAADRHGLGADYDFYRLSSAVLHGSSGGVLGQYAIDVASGEDVPIHRTGVALSLCPEAFRRGVGYFRAAVMESKTVVGEGAARDLIAACDELLGVADRYDDFVTEIDRDMWATVDRSTVETIAAIDFLGGCRWFQLDTGRNAMREAEAPTDLAPLQVEEVEALRQARREGRPIPYVDEDKVITVHLIGTHLIPKIGATWQPATLYLQQVQLSVSGHRGFTTVDRPAGWLDPSDP